jgi:hypothetical protein
MLLWHIKASTAGTTPTTEPSHWWRMVGTWPYQEIMLEARNLVTTTRDMLSPALHGE